MEHGTAIARRSISQWFVIAASVVLGAVLLSAGGQKLLGTEQMKAVFEQIGFGQWFRFFTGIWEITAAVLLVVVRLTTIGGLMAICVCLGAIATQAVNGGNAAPASALLLLSMLVTVAHGERFTFSRFRRTE